MTGTENIKAAVFDVDGTLFDYRAGCVPRSAVEAVCELKERGYLVIVATGRTKAMLCGGITEEIAPDYYILSNGALVSDRNGLRIYARTFSRRDTDLLVGLTGQYEGAMVLKYEDSNCIYYDYDAGCRLWGAGPGMDEHSTYLDQERRTHTRRLPVGISIYGDEELKSCIQGYFPVDQFHDGHGFDVMRRGIHKMTGLNLLLRKLKLGARNIVAFGDSGNDMEMVSQAGVGVAMGNGTAALKETADYVAPCSWEDGIAGALQSMGFL